MGIVFNIAIIVAAAGLGRSYGRRLRKLGCNVDTAFSGVRGRIVFGLMIGCTAALLILSKTTDVLPPDTTTLLNQAAWGITKGFLAFLGAMSVPLSSDRGITRRANYVVLTLAGLMLVQRAEAYVFSPIFPAINQDRRAPGGYVLQTQDMSCTAASLANLLSFYKLRTTEYSCAKAMGTTRFGSTTGDLVRGIRHFGFQAIEVAADPVQLRTLGRPAILSVWNSNMRHSVVWTGQRDDGTQIIIDPLSGRKEVPGPELWRSLSSSRAITVTRPPAEF